MEFEVEYAKYMNPIKINNKEIPFVDSADHVGALRSSAGNHPAILARFKINVMKHVMKTDPIYNSF